MTHENERMIQFDTWHDAKPGDRCLDAQVTVTDETERGVQLLVAMRTAEDVVATLSAVRKITALVAVSQRRLLRGAGCPPTVRRRIWRMAQFAGRRGTRSVAHLMLKLAWAKIASGVARQRARNQEGT